MLQILTNIASTVEGFLILFIIGFVVEGLRPVERLRDYYAGMFLNTLIGFFYQLMKEFSFMGFAVILAHVWQGLIPYYAISDKGNLLRAFYLSFGWLAMRDFFYYWFHRLQHKSKWLWPQHALHHSEEHVNITTAVRHHWLEVPLTVIFVDFPLLVLLKPPIVTLGFVTGILALTGLVNHLNLKLGFVPLNWIISTPQLHRIHHSKLEEHLDKNFTTFFPVWDILFGTYYSPRKNEYPPTGLASGERVTTIKHALLFPFLAWRKLFAMPRSAECRGSDAGADD
jgi:sterol desaturase/sphingolipid hydroxylase (fatty acid hydroxylase superfamily)